jgi:hypothetical protein
MVLFPVFYGCHWRAQLLKFLLDAGLILSLTSYKWATRCMLIDFLFSSVAFPIHQKGVTWGGGQDGAICSQQFLDSWSFNYLVWDGEAPLLEKTLFWEFFSPVLFWAWPSWEVASTWRLRSHCVVFSLWFSKRTCLVLVCFYRLETAGTSGSKAVRRQVLVFTQ